MYDIDIVGDSHWIAGEFIHHSYDFKYTAPFKVNLANFI